MDDYCKAVEEATDRVKRLSEDLASMIRGMPQEPLVRALMSFYGIQLLSAVIIVAELGDLRRFKKARQLMAFLGLVPSEQSSGQTIRRGSITKTGNKHVRRILVEAVNHYRHVPMRSKAVAERRRGISPEVIVIARKAERRLGQRMACFTARKKPWNKMVVALARELAGFIWAVGQVPTLLAPTTATPATQKSSAKLPKKTRKEKGHTTLTQQQQG
jgi:hypothetical protein